MANVASSSSSGGPSVLRPMYKMEAYQRRHESRPVVVKAPPVQGGTLASVVETPPPSSSSSCGYRQGGPCERGAAAMDQMESIARAKAVQPRLLDDSDDEFELIG